MIENRRCARTVLDGEINIVKTIEDLKGTIIGLTDPASTSGNLLLRLSFTKVIGSEFEGYFSRVVYTGSHDLSAVAVVVEQVDAAFVATHRLDPAGLAVSL